MLSVEGDDEARQIALRFAGQVQQIGGPRLHVLAAQDAGAKIGRLRSHSMRMLRLPLPRTIPSRSTAAVPDCAHAIPAV